MDFPRSEDGVRSLHWVWLRIWEHPQGVVQSITGRSCYCSNNEFILYHIYPMYWDTLSIYHICPKIWISQFYYLLMCLKYCCMCSEQCRSWSDSAFCGIWSGSKLFAKACLSQYVGLLRYLQGFKMHLKSPFTTVAESINNFSVVVFFFFFFFMRKWHADHPHEMQSHMFF